MRKSNGFLYFFSKKNRFSDTIDKKSIFSLPNQQNGSLRHCLFTFNDIKICPCIAICSVPIKIGVERRKYFFAIAIKNVDFKIIKISKVINVINVVDIITVGRENVRNLNISNVIVYFFGYGGWNLFLYRFFFFCKNCIRQTKLL